MKHFFTLFAVAALFLMRSPLASAETTSVDGKEEIQVSADRLEYDADRKLLIGSGNVVVSQGTDKLKADFVTVHTTSEEVYAAGNVELSRADRVWQGEELTYNFKTEEGDFGEFSAFVDPLHIRAGDSRKTAADQFEVKEVFISSCEGEKPDFYITAKEATLENDRYIKAKHAVFHLGGVPVFYFPYFKYDMEKGGHWDFTPGYRSSWGGFLLTTYNMRINEAVRSSTHLDVRSGRGLAGGQDFDWQTDTMKGKFRGYYAHDTDAHYDKDLTETEKDLIDSDRYRILLEHAQNVTDRDYVIANIDYVSDPTVMDDYFTREYEDNVQPENYISYTHVGDKFTAGLLLNTRLNDFYENINRLPEGTLNFTRQELGDSGIYYEGNNSAVYLEKVFPDSWDYEKYDTTRVDTRHMLYYPVKYFGFLNIIPRMGYQGTYYSETLETVTGTRTTTQTTTNSAGQVSTTTTNETYSYTQDGGSKWRNLPELGFESSYQAFKTLKAARGNDGGLRHVAEPYMAYTYVPEPDVKPEDLYQFDDLDALTLQNYVRLGMRNKLQTKRSGVVRNLIDLNLYLDYAFETVDDTDEATGPLVFDMESYPTDELRLRIDGNWDTHGAGISNFNARAYYSATSFGGAGIEYRYLESENDQFTTYFDLFPEEPWFGGGYWRYQIYGAVMEEQTYYIGHRGDCLGFKIGYTGRGDDWDVWFQIWLIAFPDSAVSSSMSY